MNLIKTTSGTVLNLAHAFEYSYNEEKSQLVTWWTITVSHEHDAKIASMYATERLTYHTVEKSEWLRFLEKNR